MASGGGIGIAKAWLMSCSHSIKETNKGPSLGSLMLPAIEASGSSLKQADNPT